MHRTGVVKVVTLRTNPDTKQAGIDARPFVIL
jgi:hypothetical protein